MLTWFKAEPLPGSIGLFVMAANTGGTIGVSMRSGFSTTDRFKNAFQQLRFYSFLIWHAGVP
jgi:hypothetical protein